MGLGISQNNNGGDFKPTPAGSFVARCYSVVDFGTQKTAYQGEVKEQHKVCLTFEILDEDEKREDGTPWAISQTFTASLDPKATLRKTLDGWRGRPFTEEELKEFDLSSIVGAYCQIGITHNPKKDGSGVYADVSSIAPLHKSIPRPAPVNPNVVFDMDAPNRNAVYEKLPKWQQRKVEESKEWGGDGKDFTPTPMPDYLNEPLSEEAPF